MQRQLRTTHQFIVGAVVAAIATAGFLAASEKAEASTITTYAVELKLSRLGIPVGVVDGVFTESTKRGFCAWRELTGRTAHRALPTSYERSAIVATTLLRATTAMVAGVNVNRACQSATWVARGTTGNYVKAVFPVSTGRYDTPTRVGTFTIYRQIDGWHESSIYSGAWLYRPKHFSGGQALHGSISDRLVLTYPASAGCVRMLHRDIDRLWASGVGIGRTVKVYGYWRG